MSKLKRFIEWLKNFYFRQPEVISVRPLRYTNPLRKLNVEGVILDMDEKDRKITKGGTSVHVTIKPEWNNQLRGGISREFLIQAKKRYIVLEEKGGDHNE